MEGALFYSTGQCYSDREKASTAVECRVARLKAGEKIDSPGAQKPADLRGAVKQG